MNNVLAKYIRQRFNPVLFIGLSGFVLFFSLPLKSASAAQFIILFAIVFYSLFILRLFDDIMQASNDADKPNRDYTRPGIRKKLIYYLFILALPGVVGSFWYSVELGIWVTLFLAVNFLLYRLLVHIKPFNTLLPLLKYPVMGILLLIPFSGNYLTKEVIVLSALALFFAFVVFESLEDRSFILPIELSAIAHIPVIFSFFVYTMNFNEFIPLFSARSSVMALIILYPLALLYIYLRIKGFPYVYLVFVFIIKLFLNNYGI